MNSHATHCLQRKTYSPRKAFFFGLMLAPLLPALAEAQPPQGIFDLNQTLSDGAQRTTLAFDALAMMTGNLDAQSFFPPGKVADYTGFQYLRDNDPDNMGHNTSFLTRIADNVLYILDDSQLAELKSLATAQLHQIDLYGYQRYPIMMAFRRLISGDVPADSAGLNLNSLKLASRGLYLLDGQISFERAQLYAKIFKSLSSAQRQYLDNMKGKGWSSWPVISDDFVRERLRGLPPGTAVAVMTYASDLFSWYVGSIEADVYFCPERHGTYYGGFYIKDAPAVGHEGYSISEQLTATAGSALCDSARGYVNQEQADIISSLVDTQRYNLYAGAMNIVALRTQIATLLRSLQAAESDAEAVRKQVLELSAQYGDLDGENNFHYATTFAQVHALLSEYQLQQLVALRESIMSGVYSDGTPYDYSVCSTPFLYAEPIHDLSDLDMYIGDTDYLFFEPVPTASEGEGEGEIAPRSCDADTDHDFRISLSELLRVIQFYNLDGYHCATGTEDGFAPGTGDVSGAKHSSDYNPADWLINLSELLRLVQLYNSDGFHLCTLGEDGFCPGP